MRRVLPAAGLEEPQTPDPGRVPLPEWEGGDEPLEEQAPGEIEECRSPDGFTEWDLLFG